jgi:hypothetical protein
LSSKLSTPNSELLSSPFSISFFKTTLLLCKVEKDGGSDGHDGNPDAHFNKVHAKGPILFKMGGKGNKSVVEILAAPKRMIAKRPIPA